MAAIGRARLVQRLFEAAIALATHERAAFLDEACSDDPQLRREVVSLLTAHDRADTNRILPPLDLPTFLPSLAGERFGPYRIVGEIAEGGMGAVYLVEREDVGMRAALKLVRHGRLAAREHVERFLLERRVLARLQHPNIARLLDAGVSEHGLPFLVMEYVEGERIDRYCDARCLTVEERLRLFTRVCGAVAYAHARGVVHRDLKPTNILVTDTGEPKLLDFGIAKLLKESDAESRHLTRTGSVLATPEYASPEQIRGNPVTPASDVYALGVLLYELLSGRHPHEVAGPGAQRIERIVASSDPRPLSEVLSRGGRSVNGEDGSLSTPEAASAARGTDPEGLRRLLSGDLEAILALALERDPARRYSTPVALGEEIDRYLERRPIRARRIGRRLTRLPGRITPRLGMSGALTGVLLIALTRVAIVAPGWRDSSPTPPASEAADAVAATVAVLPFAVHGGGELEYLSAGVADLLARALDGAGGLRSLEARRILSFVAASPELPLDEAARAVARHFRSELVVTGGVASVDGRLRVSALLHEAGGGGGGPVVRAEAEGPQEELFTLVDRLALQLLEARYRSTGERLVRSAASTTGSLAAYKAYLDGEEHYRELRFEAAVDAFDRAVALDSSFALAWYRLSVAAGASGTIGRIVDSIRRALRHGDRLPPHERLLVEAYAHYMAGATERSEDLYRRALESYPTDGEAIFHLADLFYHRNPYRGRSVRDSRPLFELALPHYPAVNNIHDHLINLLAWDRDLAGFDALEREIRERDAANPALHRSRLLRAAVWGDSAALASAVGAIEDRSDAGLLSYAWRTSTFSGSVPAARALAKALAQPHRAPEVRAFGALTLADLAMAEGKVREAESWLAAARREAPQRALEVEVLYATLPFRQLPRDRLESLRARLAAAPEAAETSVLNPPFRTAHVPHEAIRRWSLGILGARLGDGAAALGHAAALERLEAPPDTMRYFRSVAASIRGHLAWAEERGGEALRLLEGAWIEWPRDYGLVHFNTLGPERYARGELLFRAGRYEEALGWYASLEELAVADWIYLGPSHLRRAEIHEQLGNRSVAIEHYAHFIELWRECDAELRPLREEAERRLARLADSADRAVGARAPE